MKIRSEKDFKVKNRCEKFISLFFVDLRQAKVCSHATRSRRLVRVRTSWEEKKNVKKEQITGCLSLFLFLFLAFLRSICRLIVRVLSLSVCLSLSLRLFLLLLLFFHSSCSFANDEEQLFKLRRKRERGKRKKNERVHVCTSVLNIIHASSMRYE